MSTQKKRKQKSQYVVIVGEIITDPDIKAIHLIAEAMRISTPKMRRANLEFCIDRYGIKLKNI